MNHIKYDFAFQKHPIFFRRCFVFSTLSLLRHYCLNYYWSYVCLGVEAPLNCDTRYTYTYIYGICMCLYHNSLPNNGSADTKACLKTDIQKYTSFKRHFPICYILSKYTIGNPEILHQFTLCDIEYYDQKSSPILIWPRNRARSFCPATI